MGLDMWIYKVSKLSEEEKNAINGLSADEIRKAHPKYDLVNVDQVTDEGVAEKVFADMIPFVKKIKAANEYLNIDAIKETLGHRDRFYFVSHQYNPKDKSVTITFAWDDENEPDGRKYADIKVSTKEDCDKYIKKQVDDMYVWKQEEVAYYRKRYDIQDQMYELSPSGIENCGFHRMTDKMLQAVMRADPGFTCPELGPDDMLAYYEWY